MAILFFCLIALLTPFHRQVLPFHVNTSKPIEKSIKVMSYNVQLFRLYNWTKNKELRDEILDFIGEEKPDILCMQEYFEADVDYFQTRELLLERLPKGELNLAVGVTNHLGHAFGVATYSSLPILSTKPIVFEQHAARTNMAQYTDILWERDTIRVFNIHLASNHLKTDEVDQIIEAGNESWKITRRWIRKLRNGYRNRVEQVKILREEIERSPYPVIVCGDVNDVPVSYTYHTLSKGLKDAFLESGEWIGATYNGRLPLLRIDYILYSPTIKSAKFSIIEQAFTDHFPITCEMSLDE